MNYDKIDYIINRINDVVSVSKCGGDMSKILDEFEAPNEIMATKAKLLFGNRNIYIKTIERIITDSHLIYSCIYCENIVKHIATEIADFTDRVKGYIDHNNPFKKEQDAIIQYQNYTENEFDKNWGRLYNALSVKYPTELLDAEFYRDEFARHNVESRAYSLTRYELLKDWERQLSIKEIDYELRVLSALRQKFENRLRENLTDFRLLINQRQLDIVQIGLFWSLERGEWKQNAFDVSASYARLVYQNSSIEKLINELGRYSVNEDKHYINTTEAAGCRQFSHSKKSDIYGITESDDLSSLLPLEIVMLSESKLENDFYKRFTENRLQTFSHQSYTKQCVDATEKPIKTQDLKRGPFIVCIDTSASMCGIPEQLAKTICYGLIIKSLEQRRNCFVITFSTSVEVLDISDVRNNSKVIIDFLMRSFMGGTNLNPALEKAIEILSNEMYCNADVLFISDFIASNFNPHLITAMSEAKSCKTRFHALLIGDYYKDKLLSNFNMVWKYDSKRGQISVQYDDR